MDKSLLFSFFNFVLQILYYATPVFLIGLSFQILIIRVGHYKLFHKIVLLILIRITSLLLTSFVWLYMNLPDISWEFILMPAIVSEIMLYTLTLYLNQAIREKIELD